MSSVWPVTYTFAMTFCAIKPRICSGFSRTRPLDDQLEALAGQHLFAQKDS